MTGAECREKLIAHQEDVIRETAIALAGRYSALFVEPERAAAFQQLLPFFELYIRHGLEESHPEPVRRFLAGDNLAIFEDHG